MSTLTLKRGDTTPALDGSSDLRPEQKTSITINREVVPVVVEKKVEEKKVHPKNTKS